MAVEALKWAYSQTGLTPAQKAVLCALAWHEHSKTRALHPSLRVLAHDTAYDKSTVHRAIKQLRKTGLVEVFPRTINGNRLANDYLLKRK